MLKFILFAAILISSSGVISAQGTKNNFPTCIKRSALESLELSAESHAALFALIKAERFETGYVGYAGSPSSYIGYFNTILRQEGPVGIFEYLFDEGSAAGKLYALNGLYLTDRNAFRRAADQMKKSDATVRVLDGCLMSDEKVSKIIESDAENVAIIEPGKTMKDFWAANAGAHELDIAHGGYPATFKEMADIKPVVRRKG